MASLASSVRSGALLSSVHHRRVASFRAARAARIIVRAEGTSTASPDPPITFTRIPPLQWTVDTEKIGDVFAFSGPLPERLNGRLAMWSFVTMALKDVTTHTPIGQQFANDWGSAILLFLLLLSASMAPKFLAGVSLKELNETATAENLPSGLNMFTADLELTVGRVAMLGTAGLLIAELIKGDALF